MKQIKTVVSRRPLTIHVLIYLIGLTLVQPFVSTAQTNTPEPLQPEAQLAVDKGIIAAKVPDYLLAIRYFEQARMLAPDAPAIYLNLGLAESKIPGRELRAMAWFGAYLAAYPEAPNAAAVQEQMNVLEVRSQVNVSGLIKIVQDVASQIPSGNDLASSSLRSSSLGEVVGLWLDTGDIESAQKTAELINFAHYKTSALIEIAETKSRSGDLKGAKIIFASALKSAELIAFEPSFGIQSSATQKQRMLGGIAISQAKSGHIADALKTANLINDYHKDYALRDIAEAKAKSGDIVGALKTAGLIQQESLKNEANSLIASAQAMTGNTNTSGQPTSTPLAEPVNSVANWLNKLDDNNPENDCSLNTAPFLDLSSYLESLPPSNTSDISYGYFTSLQQTAEKILKAQNVITGMLKQEAIK